MSTILLKVNKYKIKSKSSTFTKCFQKPKKKYFHLINCTYKFNSEPQETQRIDVRPTNMKPDAIASFIRTFVRTNQDFTIQCYRCSESGYTSCL